MCTKSISPLDLLGIKLDFPILLDPAGGKNCFFREGENTVARAANAKALHITNGGIQKTLEAGKGPLWFQLTTGGELRNSQTMRTFVKRLESQGCHGICFSTDIMYVSHRERDIRSGLERSWCESGMPARDAQGKLPPAPNPWKVGIYPERPFPTPTWESLRELRSLTKLPIILKGVMRAEDGALAVENGASAVLVSNHGARQLDQVGATIEALPEVVKAVNGKIPVLCDGGFRRGTDILKALALGASAIGHRAALSLRRGGFCLPAPRCPMAVSVHLRWQPRRRSQRTRWTWNKFRETLGNLLPEVEILHPYPEVRFASKHIRGKNRVR